MYAEGQPTMYIDPSGYSVTLERIFLQASLVGTLVVHRWGPVLPEIARNICKIWFWFDKVKTISDAIEVSSGRKQPEPLVPDLCEAIP